MNTLRLILRDLFYFRAASLAVAVGMAVSTAVLAGALMVGDSVRGSLRDLALQRLGPVDFALAGTRFFDDSGADSLAERLRKAEGVAGRFEVAPSVVVTGGASVGEGASKKHAGDVQIAAAGAGWVPVGQGEALLNAETAESLKLTLAPGSPGPRVVFTFPSMEDAAREATVAQRDPGEAVAALPVGKTLPVTDSPFLSLFSLQGGQRTPRNAWVEIAELQRAVNQPGRANVLFVRDEQGGAAERSEKRRNEWGEQGVRLLNEALSRVVRLDDYGLALARAGKSDEAALTARGTYLDVPAVAAAERAAKAIGVTPRVVTVNLVNRVVNLSAGVTTRPAEEAIPSPGTPGEGQGGGSGENVSSDQTPSPALPRSTGGGSETGGRHTTLHYVIGAGISHLDGESLGAADIVLNEETARQLAAKVGDTIRLDFFRRESGGELKEVKSTDFGHSFRVAKVIPMTGLGADPTLTPEYEGLTDAESVSDWEPPAELGISGENLKLAERDNDAYWKKYKASPRFFIHIDVARKLWGGPYGDVTSIRVPLAKQQAFSEKLLAELTPASMGLSFRAVKAEQLSAAGGSTDFSMLFIAFSFFLIVAAALLVAMLLRLNIEQRARQFGLLAAVGFAPKQVRRLALAEGLALAFVGGLAGLALGVGYTWLMIYGLRTWWVGAVGTTALRLHVEPVTLAVGFLCGLLVAAAAVLWAVWRVGRTPAAQLLSGSWHAETAAGRRSGRVVRAVGVVLAVLGLAVLAMVLVKVIPQPQMALAGGALLLVAGLTWLAGRLRPRRHEAAWGLSSVAALGVRNASRHTARSVLSVGLIAFAAFTLITVASMRRGEPDDTGDPRSGAGGYRLIAQTSVPLLGDLNTPQGRRQLAVRETAPDEKTGEERPLWEGVKFTSLRRWAGQDISCLNLTRPNSPTILGVPHAMVEDAVAQRRFTFARPDSSADNWRLIEQDPGGDDAPVPVIADNETAQYILKMGVGDTMRITDPLGRPRELKLVATLSHSIFQGEMLMSEANFRRLFPAQAGYGVVLAEVPAKRVRDVQQALNTELEPYAASVDTTAGRLAMYNEIQDTYLSTFQALGALGLALGTIGLAVALVRNVIERRPELALLSAIGFRRGDRVKLVLSENAFLLVVGLGVGTGCALLGIVPTLITSREGIALGPLALTLLAVLVVGFAASAAAVWLSGVRITPADLRSE